MASDSVICGVISMVGNLLKEGPPKISSQGRSTCKWSLPGRQKVKTNVDGAFSPASHVGAWGFVIRDDAGEVVLAGAGNMGQAQDALMVEATACLRALELADQFGISHIELETDSAQLEDAIRTCSRDLSTNGVLFKAIRRLLQLRFNISVFKHVPRSCNSSVHEAALVARVWDPGLMNVWMDSLPSSVNHAVARDLAELSMINTRP